MRLRIMRFHADMRLRFSAYAHIFSICTYSAYWYMQFMRICACLFRTAYTNKLWGIRSSLNINEHSQFLQLTFSKSLIRSGGTLELTFHMSICGFSAYMRLFRIRGYPHTLCGFFYAVSCGYVHINPHKPQPPWQIPGMSLTPMKMCVHINFLSSNISFINFKLNFNRKSRWVKLLMLITEHWIILTDL